MDLVVSVDTQVFQVTLEYQELAATVVNQVFQVTVEFLDTQVYQDIVV